MATVSAGILMYHYHGGSLVVLLVHPRGPYWRNRDLGGWSIPKGELGEAEDAESAARREFKEELRPRHEVASPSVFLKSIAPRG